MNGQLIIATPEAMPPKPGFGLLLGERVHSQVRQRKLGTRDRTLDSNVEHAQMTFEEKLIFVWELCSSFGSLFVSFILCS